MSSRLDFTVLHTLRARRAARDTNAVGALSLLRRLRERVLIEALPETRVEQSWNEQLFAGILGYRTLLSHAALPFHVLPKNLAGPRRYDDFSLGFFGLDRDVVLGTAELKTAGTDLDKPQTSGNYKREAAATLERLPGFGTRSSIRLQARDGWVAADGISASGPAVRLAASRFGELQLSVAIPAPREPSPPEPTIRMLPQLNPSTLVDTATAFTTAVGAFYRVLFGSGTHAWTMSAELREVGDVRLTLHEMQDAEASPAGVCPTTDISTGDFEGDGADASALAKAAASCVSELAVHFRGERGGVGFNERRLQAHLERALSQR